jgi:hypothetical protein
MERKVASLIHSRSEYKVFFGCDEWDIRECEKGVDINEGEDKIEITKRRKRRRRRSGKKMRITREY